METSTSVAKGDFDKLNIKFKNIFRAEPQLTQDTILDLD